MDYKKGFLYIKDKSNEHNWLKCYCELYDTKFSYYSNKNKVIFSLK